MDWTTWVRFPSPPHPERLWGPPTLLSNGYRGLLPRGNSGRRSSMTTHRLKLSMCVEQHIHSHIRLQISTVTTKGKCVHVINHAPRHDELSTTQISTTPWRCLGSGSIAPRILHMGTRRRWAVSFTQRPLYSPGKRPWYSLNKTLGGSQNLLQQTRSHINLLTSVPITNSNVAVSSAGTFRATDLSRHGKNSMVIRREFASNICPG
jgi:hypothetical protein